MWFFQMFNFEMFRHWRRFRVFIVNSEHISHFCINVSIVNFEQANANGASVYFAKYFSLVHFRKIEHNAI